MLRSQYINYEYSTLLFESPKIKFLLVGGRSFFSSTKSFYLLITQNILQVITNLALTFINNLNLDTTFKVAYARFIKLEKLTYIIAKKTNPLFKYFQLIRFNMTFLT